MPQPEINQSTDRTCGARPSYAPLPLVIIECERKDVLDVYRALTTLPCRVVAIEEPPVR